MAILESRRLLNIPLEIEQRRRHTQEPQLNISKIAIMDARPKIAVNNDATCAAVCSLALRATYDDRHG